MSRPRCGDAGYLNNAGQPCGAIPVRGLDACRRHTGKSLAKARAQGEVRLAVLRWDVDQPTVDPGETLLRLVTVTAGRAQWLAELLHQAYEAAERLRTVDVIPGVDDDTDAGADAARDLDEVLARGGVSALIGKTYAADKNGGIFATGEAIRGLAALEQAERKLAADMAAKAIAAGIAERQVRLAERQAEMIAAFASALARRLGLDPGAPEVRQAIATELRALAA